MITYILISASLAFAAAVQPGPLQAYLFSRVTALGWRKTLPAALAPLLSDGPIALLAVGVLGRLPPDMHILLRFAGGILLLILAWTAFRQLNRDGSETVAKAKKIPRTLLEAAVVNLLNPNPYLGWALVIGPLAVDAWRISPGNGVVFVAAFYVTMVTMLAVLIVTFGGMRMLGPRLQRGLVFLSVVILAAIGVYQLAMGVAGLRHM